MYHRLHHAYGADMGLNLGAVLTVWDVLSRRATFPIPGARARPPGLPPSTSPSSSESKEWRPGRVLLAQLAEPFAGPRASEVGHRPVDGDDEASFGDRT